jgi:hypothetical protein
LTIAVSALIGSLIFVAILFWPPADWITRNSALFLNVTALSLAISLPLVALGLIVVGLPVDWLLRRLEQRGRLAYGLLGGIGGLLFGLIVGATDGLIGLELYGWAGLLYGALTALVFRLVFGRFRPPEDQVPG